MQDKLIFNLEDIRKVRKVSANIDDFDLYAQEVQRNFLQKILGDKLYTALQQDLDVNGIPQTQRFVDLVNGVIYINSRDIIFRGVKLYCSYLWLYMYTSDSAVNITPIGVQLFKDEYAENAEAKQSFRNASSHYQNAADGLEEPILRYLDFKRNEFPEFSESYELQPARDVNLSFRVIGQKFTPPDEFIQ